MIFKWGDLWEKTTPPDADPFPLTPVTSFARAAASQQLSLQGGAKAPTRRAAALYMHSQALMESSLSQDLPSLHEGGQPGSAAAVVRGSAAALARGSQAASLASQSQGGPSQSQMSQASQATQGDGEYDGAGAGAAAGDGGEAAVDDGARRRVRTRPSQPPAARPRRPPLHRRRATAEARGVRRRREVAAGRHAFGWRRCTQRWSAEDAIGRPSPRSTCAS